MDPEQNLDLKIPVVSLFDFVKIPENCSSEQRLQIQDASIFAERRFSGISVEDEMKLTDGFVSIFNEDKKFLCEQVLVPDAAERDANEAEVDANMDDDCVSDSHEQGCVVGKYACQICGQRFDQKSSRKNHQVTHSQRGVVKCATCHKGFARESDLGKHLKSCVEMFKLRLELTERSAGGEAGGEAPYRCDRCPEAFALERLLNDHQHAHDTRSQCQVCHKMFRDRSNLRRHAMVHTGEKPFGCAECGVRFRIKHHWQQHQTRHRQESMLDCDFCGKLFAAKSALKEHLGTHLRPRSAAGAESAPEPEFQCARCAKRFATRKKLQRHAATHSERKRYGCAACGRAFHDKSNLNKHELIHTGEKLFKCAGCAKAFRLKHQRDRHRERVHRLDLL